MWLLLSRKIKTIRCYGGLLLLCCSGVAVVFLDVTLSYNSTVVALKLKNQNLPVWCGGGVVVVVVVVFLPIIIPP